MINKNFKLNLDDYNCGMMSMNILSMKSIRNEHFINYPEPQIILKLSQNKLSAYSIINIIQRKRISGISA